MFEHLDTYVAVASAVIVGLIALGHALESVVALTATKADDNALAKVMSVLTAVGSVLPKIRFGGK